MFWSSISVGVACAGFYLWKRIRSQQNGEGEVRVAVQQQRGSVSSNRNSWYWKKNDNLESNVIYLYVFLSLKTPRKSVLNNDMALIIRFQEKKTSIIHSTLFSVVILYPKPPVEIDLQLLAKHTFCLTMMVVMVFSFLLQAEWWIYEKIRQRTCQSVAYTWTYIFSNIT